MIDTRAIRLRWEADGSKRDERGKRLFAASGARAAGWGASVLWPRSLGSRGHMRRVQQRALAIVEGRVAEAGRRNRHTAQGLPITPRHGTKETNRKPRVFA